MKRNFNRIKVSIIAILILFVIVFPKSVIAADLGEMISQAESFIKEGKDGNGVDPGEIAEEFVPLGQLLTMIGMGVMVAVTTYMGIKYLTASPEGQAKLKQQLIGLVVAGIVIFGAYYIWSLVIDIAEKLD